MTIAVIGASGLIGRHLFTRLRKRMDVEGTYFHNAIPGGIALDVTDPAAVRDYVSKRDLRAIIWLSGTKDVPRCDRDAEHAFRLNTAPVATLAEAVAGAGGTIRILFFSTDYVFDGVRGLYRDSDVCTPHTEYGKSNLAAEEILKRSGLPHTVIRTSAVMAHGGGFLGWLMGRLGNGERTPLYENVFFSPTPFLTLARGVDAILDDTGNNGRTVHIAGERTNRYEFARKVANVLRADESLVVPEKLDIGSSAMQADLSLLPSAAVAEICGRWREDLAEDLRA